MAESGVKSKGRELKFTQYYDKATMMTTLAALVAHQLREGISDEGRATLAVPGGTTPGPMFDVLCKADLDWAKVGVLLTDERWVPEDSDRSNTKLLRERLLIANAAVATYIPLYADAPKPEEKLGDLAKNLSGHLPLTVVVLGMGADMHTASIFPEADRLNEALTGDDLLVAMRAPGAPEPRITLSAKVLNEAAHRHIVIVGAEKREALERAKTLSAEAAPVSKILLGSTVHWADA